MLTMNITNLCNVMPYSPTLSYYSTLKMQAAGSSETFVNMLVFRSIRGATRSNLASIVTLLNCIQMCPVRISVGIATILTELYPVFPQSFQENYVTVPQNRPQPRPSSSF
jgi:hypothetical protein